MSAAICLLLYGAALAWPVAVWLCAIAMAFGAWVAVAIGLMFDVTAGGVHTPPIEYCMRMVHELNHFGIAGRVTLALAGTAAVASSVVVGRRIVLALRRFWTSSRNHAHDARLLGAASLGLDVVVVSADRPAAYCVAGRPDAIVLTTGAIDTLSQSELAAVLAHEQAHLAGRHLQLMMLLRSLSSAMPRLPLFRNAVRAVGRLVEMCADDTAARQYGRPAVLGGLVALAGQPRATGGALGVADRAALARAIRLSEPVRHGARLRQRVLLASTTAALIVTPVALSAICHL